MEKITIEISTSTILKIIASLLILYFLFLIRNILLILVVAIIFAIALSPFVDYLKRKRIPRTISVFFIYLIIILILGLVITLVSPLLIEQIKRLANDFPHYYNKIVRITGLQEAGEELNTFQQILESWGVNIEKATKTTLSLLLTIFGGLLSFFLILILNFYFLIEKEALVRFFQGLAPSKIRERIITLFPEIQKKMNLWLRGQILVCFIIFILSYIGLLILGVDYALLLAFIAGITEIIPYLGPILGAIPAVILAFVQSPIKGFFVLILYWLIQQLENYLIAPKVMSKVVTLNPIVIILSLWIGGKIGGLIGVLIAIPLVTILSVILKGLLEKKENLEIKN